MGGQIFPRCQRTGFWQASDLFFALCLAAFILKSASSFSVGASARTVNRGRPGISMCAAIWNSVRLLAPSLAMFKFVIVFVMAGRLEFGSFKSVWGADFCAEKSGTNRVEGFFARFAPMQQGRMAWEGWRPSRGFQYVTALFPMPE